MPINLDLARALLPGPAACSLGPPAPSAAPRRVPPAPQAALAPRRPHSSCSRADPHRSSRPAPGPRLGLRPRNVGARPGGGSQLPPGSQGPEVPDLRPRASLPRGASECKTGRPETTAVGAPSPPNSDRGHNGLGGGDAVLFARRGGGAAGGRGRGHPGSGLRVPGALHQRADPEPLPGSTGGKLSRLPRGSCRRPPRSSHIPKGVGLRVSPLPSERGRRAASLREDLRGGLPPAPKMAAARRDFRAERRENNHCEGAEPPLPKFRSHHDWKMRVQLELCSICVAVPALFGRGSPFGV